MTGHRPRQSSPGLPPYHARRVVLDLMVPGLDGMVPAGSIPQRRHGVMLTAWAEAADEIVGLSTGADDYVTQVVLPAS